MSAVLQFPTAPERTEWRISKAASEAAVLAGLYGYGLLAVQNFQRRAARMAETSSLSPSAIALRVVPKWDARLGDGPEDAA